MGLCSVPARTPGWQLAIGGDTTLNSNSKNQTQHKHHQQQQADYVTGERKFGGNAQAITGRRWLHHTSLLWDFDAANMALLTNPARQPEYRRVSCAAAKGGGMVCEGCLLSQKGGERANGDESDRKLKPDLFDHHLMPPSNRPTIIIIITTAASAARMRIS